MKKIPSNFSLEETISFLAISEAMQPILEKIEPFLKKVSLLEEELRESRREFGHVDEQDSFKYNLLEEIQELCEGNGSKRDLVKAINLAFENSYVEM